MSYCISASIASWRSAPDSSWNRAGGIRCRSPGGSCSRWIARSFARPTARYSHATFRGAVAAFRFGRVADSYAAQTGSDHNVGVIGLAIFAERGARWTRGELHRRDTADPFPQRDYAAPPR